MSIEQSDSGKWKSHFAVIIVCVSVTMLANSPVIHMSSFNAPDSSCHFSLEQLLGDFAQQGNL